MTQPGPLRGLRFIHTALAIELELLEQDARRALGGSMSVDSVKERFDWIGYVLDGHAIGEDVGVLGVIAERFAHVADSFEDDHRFEEELRDNMISMLRDFTSGDSSAGESFTRATSELLHTTVYHMNKEERLLIPLIEENFTLPEQGEMMGKMMATFPADFMGKAVPWMFKRLEGNDRIDYALLLKNAMPPEPFEMFMQMVEQEIGNDAWGPIASAIEH